MDDTAKNGSAFELDGKLPAEKTGAVEAGKTPTVVEYPGVSLDEEATGEAADGPNHILRPGCKYLVIEAWSRSGYWPAP